MGVTSKQGWRSVGNDATEGAADMIDHGWLQEDFDTSWGGGQREAGVLLENFNGCGVLCRKIEVDMSSYCGCVHVAVECGMDVSAAARR